MSLPEERLAGYCPDDRQGELSIYLHVPFCRSRCSYCDFFLVTRLDHVEAFFKALAVETATAEPLLRNRTVKAVHFGGGTPSLVPVSFLGHWLEQLLSLSGGPANCMEVTLEANPEDLDARNMQQLRSIGINRISLGIQSYRQRKIEALGRKHTAGDAIRVSAAALRWFDTVSADLICGVPDESIGEWRADLQTALAVGLPHLSVYMLSVEPRTVLERRIAEGLSSVPAEQLQASMYACAADLLRAAGYSHYEVSNFAFPGHHSRYNLACWMREPYLGFGPSAHSFTGFNGREKRKANVASLFRYLANPAGCTAFEEFLSDDERFIEQVFLSLRINQGLGVEFLRKRDKLGLNLSAMLAEFVSKEWILIENDVLFLTPKGFLFADYIAGELISG